MADSTTRTDKPSKAPKSKTKPRRLSKGWRKHIRRLKQAARKSGATKAS